MVVCPMGCGCELGGSETFMIGYVTVPSQPGVASKKSIDEM